MKEFVLRIVDALFELHVLIMEATCISSVILFINIEFNSKGCAILVAFNFMTFITKNMRTGRLFVNPLMILDLIAN